MKTILHTLARFAETVRFGFCRLTEIQFNAPWSTQRSRCG